MSAGAPSGGAVTVRRALLSVSDKTGLVAFAQGLAALGAEILSTGGTAAALRAAGLRVTDVSEVTGFPEMLDGRVKTLHPRIHGALLGLRDNAAHRATMTEHGIAPIDLVCVNLYPFEQTIARGCTDEEAIEQIDIGGPAMIRSAAKNHRDVAVVTSPSQYDEVLALLRANGGRLPAAKLRELARDAYRRTSRYDQAIDAYLSGDHGQLLPGVWRPVFEKVRDLRYGENPHQRGAAYVEAGAEGPCVARAGVLSGKELSYNNLLDLDAALRLVREFDAPACAVIKHATPCGCAVGADARDAWVRAHAGDPVSAFGCVVALNRKVDAAAASAIARPDQFVECIVAPDFDADAVSILTTSVKWGKSVRLLACGDLTAPAGALDRSARRILGGMLVQDHDTASHAEWRAATKRAPTESEDRDLRFAWKVAKHVASNAIVVVKDGMLLGAGGGQTSRVDSARIAVAKAGERVRGAVAAGDAFFPFRDGLDVLLRAGVTACVQPGGSVRDAEVVSAADEAGAAMVLTGMRHFRHG
ncbi:MAG: Bifunctional purine biosynthesis protein PurH [Planctomycetes bacterium]|nr:Bifunctional purine biosynthesis protein PurH [Planctomycetota bacterium]